MKKTVTFGGLVLNLPPQLKYALLFMISTIMFPGFLVAREKPQYTRIYKPSGFKIEAGFIPEKTEIILGQPLLARFVFTNLSDKDYSFTTGGPNRSSVRDNSFRITAIDEDGQNKNDSHTYNNFEGKRLIEELQPGDTYSKLLLLSLWLNLDKPGKYTVTCEYDLSNHRNSNFPAVTASTSFQLVVVASDTEKMGKVITELGRRIRAIADPMGKEVSNLVAKQHPELVKKAHETNHSEAMEAVRRISYLEQKLKRENAEELSELTLAISAIPDEAVIPYLATSLSKGSSANAIEGLSRFPTDASAVALRQALASPDQYVRAAAAKALQQINKTDDAVDILLKDISDVEAQKRAVAARALGTTGSHRALAPLTSILRDTNSAVREEAAEAIGVLGYPEGIPTLEQLVKGNDLPLRVAAAKGLLVLKQQLPLDQLTEVIRKSGPRDRHFHEAIRLSKLYGGPQAASALTKCIHFDDPSDKDSYNMYLILAIGSCTGAPNYYYQWHSNLNNDATPQQIKVNRKILAELKAWLEKR